MAGAFRSRTAWLFPVPVRASRFRASATCWSRFNIEVAQDLIQPFSFDDSSAADSLLFYDFQTELELSAPGRLGSGRGGIYLGRYVKGVGRTPAAANWLDPRDRFHASGHLSVTSAIRERLITVALSSRGLRHTIVPCDAVLLRRLSPSEEKAVGSGATSSDPLFTPADGRMCALTVKPADFARSANFVFAFQHAPAASRTFGTLFLDFERYLHAPGDRKKIEGDPARIARAMETALYRGIENFEAFARAGLLWVYVRGNFTLDGRFLDLETPHYFGCPFVGFRTGNPPYERQFLGFEEFYLIRHWRRFLQWMDARLSHLCEPGVLHERQSRLFLQQLQEEIANRFCRNHFLFQDPEIQMRATANLSNALHLGTRASKRLLQLARSAFAATVYGAAPPTPDRSWRPVRFQPGAPLPIRFQYQSPGFFEPQFTEHAEVFATRLKELGEIRNIDTLLLALSRPFRSRY